MEKTVISELDTKIDTVQDVAKQVKELCTDVKIMSEGIKGISKEITQIKTVLHELKTEKKERKRKEESLLTFFATPSITTLSRCLSYYLPFGYLIFNKYKSFRFKELPFIILLSLFTTFSPKVSITLICLLLLHRIVLLLQKFVMLFFKFATDVYKDVRHNK